MSRTRTAAFALATDFAGQGLLTLAGFITPPIILRYISGATYGFWLTTLSVITYLSIADLGLGTAFIQKLSRKLALDVRAPANDLVGTAFVSFVGTGAFVLVAGLSMLPLIPKMFDIPATDVRPVSIAYVIVVMSAALSAPCNIYSGMLCGSQRLAANNIIRTASGLGGIILSIILLGSGMGLPALAVGTIATTLATAMAGAVVVRALLPHLRIRLSCFNLHQLRALLRFGGSFQIGRIANSVALSASPIVVATTMGAEHVTTFAFTTKLGGLLSFTLASKLSIAVFPGLTQLFAHGNPQQIQSAAIRLTAYATRFTLFSGFLFAMTNEAFVTSWVGTQHYGGAVLTTITAVFLVLECQHRGTIAMIYASGQLKGWVTWSVIETILNVTASLYLASRYGLPGAAAGIVLSKAFTTMWFVPLQISRTLNMSLKDYLLKSVLLPALRAAPGFVLVGAISLLVVVEHRWVWIGSVAFLSILAAVAPFEGLVFVRNPARILRSLWGRKSG